MVIYSSGDLYVFNKNSTITPKPYFSINNIKSFQKRRTYYYTLISTSNQRYLAKNYVIQNVSILFLPIFRNG